MIKKKKIIELQHLHLEFQEQKTLYKILKLKTTTMTVETQRYENNKYQDNFELPFAHLPKKLKKIIKPN